MAAPTLTKTPSEIADEVIGLFECAGIDTVRQYIIASIRAEREVTMYYINQMNKWAKGEKEDRS